MLLVLLGSFICFRLIPGKGLEKRIQAIRDAGMPTTLAEWNAWYPNIPASNNAALVFQEAASHRRSRDQEFINLAIPKAGELPNQAYATHLKAHLADNQQVLEKIHAAATLPASRYPLNLTLGSALLLPHLAEIKSIAQLLRYEALHHTLEGHRDEAFRSLTTGFALVRSLREEPILISYLVRVACLAINLQALEYLLSAHPLSPAQLETLSQLLSEAEADGKRALFRGLAGERASALSYFTMSGSELQQLFTIGGPSPIHAYVFNIHRALGLRDRDLRYYLDLMEQFVAASTNSFPAAFQLSQRAGREMDQQLSTPLGKLAILTRMVIPALSKAIEKEAVMTTRLHYARIAIAVERYRQAHENSLPSTLKSLVPEFLPELPVDPIHGQPYLFLPSTERGYEISSPGASTTLKIPSLVKFIVRR